MDCCFCHHLLENGQPTTVLREKGCETINRLSETDGRGKVEVHVEQRVHSKCRREFTKPRRNTSRVATESTQPNINRRSQTPTFVFKEHCIFCSQPAKYVGKKRGYEVIPVRTKDFQTLITDLCSIRNDEWSAVVKGKLEYARDLHAADAVYHQSCSINFRTGKQIPKKYRVNAESFKRKRGRPSDSAKNSAFEKVATFLEENDEEHITISDLTSKMKELLEEIGEQPYSEVYMKKKLQDHFGDKIVITNVMGGPNVVTFRRSISSIINEFNKQPKNNDYEEEKKRIVVTAAKLIKSEIKNLDCSSTDYPSCEEMESIDQALGFLPIPLHLLLKNVFVGKDVDLKIASIGQAIIQAARPRAIIAPLQLGLGVQMHHHSASKFIIDALNSHGFCSSYTIVQKFERSAAVNQGTEIPGHNEESFEQYTADNLDHNIRTLDGNGTFHGMGIISIMTPGVRSKQLVPNKFVSNDEILAAGRIDMRIYEGPKEDNIKLKYKALKDLNVKDATSNLDLLWKITLPLVHSPRPGWAGTMQGICRGHHPGKSSVMFLPIIDLDPTDMTCVYSTLHFVSNHAKRYNITPILTFDQPLWWKALTIQLSEPENSDLKRIVLRLGGFHIQMSFLGCIGNLMAESGLKEILELVYAKNAVVHMLSGKAVSRAIRGHFLIDDALNKLLVSKAYNLPLSEKTWSENTVDTPQISSTPMELEEHHETAMHTTLESPEQHEPCISMESQERHETAVYTTLESLEQHEPCTSMESEERHETAVYTTLESLEQHEPCISMESQERHETTVYTLESPEQHETSCTTIENQFEKLPEKQSVTENTEAELEGIGVNEDLESAVYLWRQIENRECKVEELNSSDVINRISKRLEELKISLNTHRTAVLWIEYMKMLNLLREFIKAERTGNWTLHLKAVKGMLPYFTAAGHNLYAKSAHIYLQMMEELERKSPDVYRRFMDGYHCARRSNRYWAGLSTDLMIEQVLMRSAKTSGGLTRGKGFSEVQRLVWVLSMPACAEMNNAMQSLTTVRYETSEQHKDATKSRMLRDHKDIQKVVDYLIERDPFADDKSLRSIVSGVVASDHVNVDKCKEVGDKVLRSMIGNNAYEYSFRRKDQAVTLASKTAVKLKDGEVLVDSRLLFQRLSIVATGGQYNNPGMFFNYEMSSYPPALFDSSLLPLQANKPALADAIWGHTKDEQPSALPAEDVHYVLDGGALLHRIIWPRGATYSEIMSMYNKYVMKRYGQATIVFDGYEEGPSTKDCAHLRRVGICGPPVNFECNMVLTLKKDEFLRNSNNKQRFINLLGESLQLSGCTIIHSKGDADLMIVQTAIQSARETTTILVGDDTDLLVLLCHHAEKDSHDLFFAPQPKQKSTRRKIWDIKKTVCSLGPDVCANILFVHVILGCDTTSRLFGLGKGTALKKISSDTIFRNQACVFNRKDASKDDVIVAGERALLCLYNARKDDDRLDSLRYARFCQKISSGTTFVEPGCLPPTSAAAVYHSLRVYHQVQTWKGITLEPQDWGWTVENGKLMPLKTDLPAAHESLLELVRCNCKADCRSKRCSCRKHGLECTAACGSCRGQSCTNSPPPEIDESDEL